MYVVHIVTTMIHAVNEQVWALIHSPYKHHETQLQVVTWEKLEILKSITARMQQHLRGLNRRRKQPSIMIRNILILRFTSVLIVTLILILN
jgi:hypothetical protein